MTLLIDIIFRYEIRSTIRKELVTVKKTQNNKLVPRKEKQ